MSYIPESEEDLERLFLKEVKRADEAAEKIEKRRKKERDEEFSRLIKGVHKNNN